MRPKSAIRTALALLGLIGCGAASLAAPDMIRVNDREYLSVESVELRLRAPGPGSAAPRGVVSYPRNGREAIVGGLRLWLGDPTVERGGRLYVSRIDFEKRLLPILKPGSQTPPAPLRTIVIDPGHGGDDNGAENRRLGFKEKTFTLDTAKRLKPLLEAQGYHVLLTRTEDVRLVPFNQPADLHMRADIANRAGADLFISIHFNSVEPDTKTRGTEVYVFAPEHQCSTSAWQTGEDDAEPNAKFPDHYPAVQYGHWSVVLAHAVHRDILRVARTEDRGEKIKHLAVLRYVQCPAILVESAFLSNDAEARRIGDPVFRQTLAEAMASGVADYAAIVDSLRPRSPAPSAVPAPAPASFRPVQGSAVPPAAYRPTRPPASISR